MSCSLALIVFVLCFRTNVVVGFTSWGWARSPAYLLLASEKITHDLSAFNETVVLGEAIRSSDVFTNRRRKITSEKKNAKKTLPIVGQKNQGSNEEDDFSECLRDPAKAIQKVRKIRHVKDIHTWMQEVVRNGAERPFGRWSVKAQIDFVKVLQDYQAYEPIMFFLRHVGKASVKVCTTAIFSMALSSDHRYLASEILDFMEEQKVRPTSLTFIALLGSIDGAKATSQMMKRIESYKDVQLSAEVFNSAIFACKRKGKENDESNDWQTALNLLQVMRRKRIQPTVKTYHATLQVLAGTGQVQMAKSIMQQLHSTPDMKPDDRVWAAAMNVCADALDYNGAIDFLNQMQAGGHRPNLLHASILLKAFALSGKDVMSLQALEMMTRKEQTSKVDDLSLSFHLPPMFPDLIALNTIISACAHAGNIPAALSVVARMREGEFQDPVNGKIIFPDRISYHNILRSCQDPDIAMDIIKEMRLSRRKRYGVVTPSSVTYAHAINTCQQAEEADVMRATTLLSWALDDGIKPTVYMFVPAIWAAQRSGDRTAALDFFLQMLDFGCTPNAVAYNGVISALCDNCDVEHAILIYEEMKDRGMNLNASVFKSIEQVEEQQYYLERIFSLMGATEKTVGIGGSILEALIGAYGAQSQFDKALKTFYAIVGRVDGPCLRAILLACSTANPLRWEDAIDILHTSDIVEDNSGPGCVDQVALGYAISVCAKANEPQEALTLLNLYGRKCMYRSRRSTKIPSESINSLIAACGRVQRPDLALEVFSSMESQYDVRPDTRSYRNAAIACNKAQHDELRFSVSNLPFVTMEERNSYKWWECALSLLRRMREDGLTPDVATFSATISACEAAGEWQRALGVLQMMMDDVERDETLLNIYCFNAAISACEKGQAWVEALELYERMLDIGGAIFPNVVTLNSLLVALENAGQKELARSKYYEGRKLKIVNPWRRTKTANGETIRAMDLHMFSAAMAKAAVRSFMDGLTLRSESNRTVRDLLIISGKGLHSEKDPVLQNVVLSVLSDEYRVEANVDELNSGRIIVTDEHLRKFIAKNAW